MGLRQPDISDPQLSDNLGGLDQRIGDVQAAARKRLTAVEARATTLEPTAWTTVTPTAPWVDSNAATYGATAYRKEGDIVRLKGTVKNGTVTTTIFTLPTGHRPAKAMNFAVDDAAAYGLVLINPDGTVVGYVGNTSVSLNGISFSTT